MFYISLLEKHIIIKEVIDPKIASQLEFKEKKQLEEKINTIISHIVFPKEVIDSKLLELYYFIY